MTYPRTIDPRTQNDAFYPRTMRDAFRNTVDYAASVECVHKAHPVRKVVFRLVIALILILLFALAGCADKRNEFAQSDLMKLDQRDDALRLLAIGHCKKTNGDGVAPRFDSNDVVTGCKARWGKS